jgi:hypothetical protein
LELRKAARDLHPGDHVWDIVNDAVHTVAEVYPPPAGADFDIVKIVFTRPIKDGLGEDKCGMLITATRKCDWFPDDHGLKGGKFATIVERAGIEK